VSRFLRYAMTVGGAVVAILLFLLATASDNSGLMDRYYSWLLGLNVAIALSLVVMVVVLMWRLYRRFKAGHFGSRLMVRMVLLFASIGIIPGLVIFLVSLQFVSHSIDTWFNVQIEAALDAGLKLGINALDVAVADLGKTARDTRERLVDQDNEVATAVLVRLVRNNVGMQNAMLVNADGKLITSAMAVPQKRMLDELPTTDMLRQARTPIGYAAPESGGDVDKDPRSKSASPVPEPGGLRLRSVLMIGDHGGGPARYLQILQSVPLELGANAELLRSAYSDYKERGVARVGLRKMFIVTLVLALLLAIVGAIGAAFISANNLARPLLVLAEGTRAVAEGDFSPRPIVTTKDELGTLTQSFNTMTSQLFDARSAVERNRAALQDAKVHLESVLQNMSAGVMVMKADFSLHSSNDAAQHIFQIDLAAHMGTALGAIDGMAGFTAAISKAFSTQSAQSAAGSKGQRTHWQQEIEIPRPFATEDDQAIILLARGSRLPVGSGSGFIVVFDDITDVISAQRSIAWGEVARRLAHEIKNPLTPIQLSAERMQMKLAAHLPPKEAELLGRGTATIVKQVEAMKRMVDDFRDYARTPPAVLLPLDLNSLINEILHLYLAGDTSDIIHPHLEAALPLVMGDATQLRQVIHNLLANAQDAMADRAPGAEAARIDVRTEAIHYRGADGSEGTAVRLAIVDNGPGFAPKILQRAFEPYVTSKARGTGLGLPMVKKIIDEHGGKIDIANHAKGSGASILILLLKLAPAPSPVANLA
jgi:nitrogen fixation/metabolism regulation signal transduction histidine kinase